MKKSLVVILFLFFAVITYAQETYIGVRGGIIGGNLTVQPIIPKKTNWNGFEGGLIFRRISGERWVGGIQTELNYVNTSFTFFERNESDSSFVRNVTQLELPFMWHPSYGFGAKENFKVFLNAGPYVSYMLKSRYEYIDKLNPSSEYNRSADYVFNRHFDVRLGYGVMGGAGFEVMLTPNIQAVIEFRYKFSLSDIWKYKSKVDPAISAPTDSELDQMFRLSEYAQSQITQMGVSFGIMYKFGKKRVVADKKSDN